MNDRATFLLLIGALGGASLQGAIIYQQGEIPIPTTFDGVYLDIDTGATSTSPFVGFDVNPFFGGVAIFNSADFQAVRSGTANTDPILNLPLGQSIDGSTDFYSSGFGGSSTHVGTGSDQFGPGESGYSGFEFTPSGGGGVRYGWIRYTLTVNAPGGVIHEWAFQDDGSAIYPLDKVLTNIINKY